MKKFLLYAAVALLVSAADAQTVPRAPHGKAAARMSNLIGPSRKIQMNPEDFSRISSQSRMSAGESSSRKASSLRGSSDPKPYYRRPAGMFPTVLGIYNGYLVYYGDEDHYINRAYLMAKPYAEYHWTGHDNNPDATTNYSWNILVGGTYNTLDYRSDFYYSVPPGIGDVPYFNATIGPLDSEEAEGVLYRMQGTCFGPYPNYPVDYLFPFSILSAESSDAAAALIGDLDGDFIPLYSSKTMIPGGINGDLNEPYIFKTYTGLDPWGDNELGWWFGKNSSHIDGIGQVFEKPEHPYRLKGVHLYANEDMVVHDDVTLTCKIYRLDDIPAYDDNSPCILPDEPGELIAEGFAEVTPATGSDNEGLISFTLIGRDEYDPCLVYQINPVIDYPIMICIDGYNDEGMENLVDFHAYISYDEEADEGFGELAYIKVGRLAVDQQGNTILDENDNYVFSGEYDWHGLYQFFSNSASMKTGFSIFIETDNPYVIFANKKEDGEYLFSNNGGYMDKTFCDGDAVFNTRGIEFQSSVPSEDEDWILTCDGSEDIPDWLSINLSDSYVNGSFTGKVFAEVTAARLPSNVDYREATIRFDVQGGHIDYTFMQGTKPVVMLGDVNSDSQVSITDVTSLIDYLLNTSMTVNVKAADVNGDGQVTITDVTRLIDYLLGSVDINPVVTGNKTFTVNGVTFKMIAVEGGTFAMGATRDQGTNVRSVEKPVHMVTLSDYYIGQTEVTQALWLAVMGSNPSHYTGDLNRPVEMVSWDDCQTFITKLNQMTGMQFRLPTEAEWEFAARGGNKTLGNMYSGSNTINEVAWYNGNAGNTSHRVAGKSSNELGIFDMSGNIYEYCYDWWNGTGYSSEPQVNPTGLETGTGRIIRGGSIDYGDEYCRNAYRWGDATDSRWKDQGLRLAL